jgi:hypothetical protein
MPEPRAQRTLVKSPPELWAEVSDLEALARHLGEFGEIRITRLEPETTVAWEGDRARGTVELEPAGWGTKVTLTAQLTEAEAPTVAIDPVEAEAEAEAGEPESEPLAVAPRPGAEEGAAEALGAELEPQATEPAPQATEPRPKAAEPEPQAAEPEPQGAEPEPLAAAEPAASEPTPKPRAGFFARLFGRRKTKPEPAAAERETLAEPEPVEEPHPLPEPEPAAAELGTPAEPEPVAEMQPPREPEPGAVADPGPPTGAEVPPEPVAVAEPVAELQRATTLDGDRAQAILTGVLDDLGSAHHRPFSRG